MPRGNDWGGARDGAGRPRNEFIAFVMALHQVGRSHAHRLAHKHAERGEDRQAWLDARAQALADELAYQLESFGEKAAARVRAELARLATLAEREGLRAPGKAKGDAGAFREVQRARYARPGERYGRRQPPTRSRTPAPPLAPPAFPPRHELLAKAFAEAPSPTRVCYMRADKLQPGMEIYRSIAGPSAGGTFYCEMGEVLGVETNNDDEASVIVRLRRAPRTRKARGMICVPRETRVMLAPESQKRPVTTPAPTMQAPAPGDGIASPTSPPMTA